MFYKLLLSTTIVILILFAFVKLIKLRRCLHLYITSCKSTWDTVPYFGLNGMPMILFLWSPPPPLIKNASNTIQSSKLGRTTLNEWEEGSGYFIEWPASMQIYWNKRKCLHKKGTQLLQDWFGTLTLPPFHCFRTPIRPPWRHVKTLYITDIWLAAICRERPVFRRSVSTFLQLVVASEWQGE